MIKHFSGEWRQWRKDSQRSGKADLPGKITEPVLAVHVFLGGIEDWLIVSCDASKSEGTDGRTPQVMELPENAEDKALDSSTIRSLRREWGLERWIDVEGSGCPEPVEELPHVRYVKNFGPAASRPNGSGYRRLVFESAFDKGMQDEDTRGWLEERVNGEWRRLWTTKQDRHYYRPNIVLADIDGDGRDEIVLTVHYRIIAIDPDTGEHLRDLHYHPYRNYGELHAVDLTGNGLCDFVQLVNFPAHLEVILNDGKKFEPAWFHDIQKGDITDCEHLIRAPYNPVFDLDGDGTLEVIYAGFNEHGDHCWHTLVLEAVTGRVKADIADFVAVECVRDPADHQPYLFGIRSDGSFIPKDGGAAIARVSLDDERTASASIVWSDASVSWCMWTPYPWDQYRVSRCMPDQKQRIAMAGSPSTVWCRRSANEELLCCRFQSGKIVIGESVKLAPFDVMAMKEDGSLLVRTRRPLEKRSVTIPGAIQLQHAGSRLFEGEISPPVVVGDATTSARLVAVPDLLGRIRCFERSDQGWVERWSAVGTDAGERGICAARSSGRNLFVYVSSDERGAARIEWRDPDGRRVHEARISRTHAVLQPGEDGGMLGLHVLPLMEPGEDDVLIIALKNNMHSGFTEAWSLKSGRLWRKDKSGTVLGETRGYGGSRPFAGWPKPDGTEDIVSEFPDLLYIADGRTGEFSLYLRSQFGAFYGYDAGGDVMKNKAVLYGIPIVVPDSEAYGGYVVYWGGCSFLAGVWERTAESGGFRWYSPFQATLTANPLQAIGYFDNTARLEVIGWEHSKGALTCRDFREGGLLWTIPLAGGHAGRYFAVCDINGDGIDECLLCTNDELLAVASGEIVWRLQLPAPCTQPVIADADGDGFSEILLPCSDGRLYEVRNAV
jgi:hypothetical protein